MRLKTIGRGVLSNAAVRSLVSRVAGGSSILMYHRITEEESKEDSFRLNDGLSVHPKDFEKHMQYVARNCQALSLSDYISELKNGSLARKSVTLTFDDGYKDNLELALPILEKYDIPATIYVCTGLIEGSAPLWWYEIEKIVRELPRLKFEWEGRGYDYDCRDSEKKGKATIFLHSLFVSLDREEQESLMSLLRKKVWRDFSYEGLFLNWSEIRSLAKHPLITIAAHTHSHPVLARLTREEVIEEIESNKKQLEQQISQKVTHFAYPYGWREAASHREFRIVEQLGFESATTTRYGHIFPDHAEYLFSLPRITVDNNDCLSKFKAKLSGVDAFIRYHGSMVVNC